MGAPETTDGGESSGLPFSAPLGGGGPGFFVQPLSPGQDPIPLQNQPPGQAAPLQSQPAPNPPPPTVPSTTTVVSQETDTVHISVRVRVLEDNRDNSLAARSAKTRINVADVTYATPNYQAREQNGVVRITRLTSKFTLAGTITIRTSYGPNAGATDTSQYGRGTTATDRQAGNTSLGFHESCHRTDFLTYLANHPFPSFGGQVGMTVDEFNQAVAAFEQAFNAYAPAMTASSEQQTDEVGYTRSQCRQDGRCQ